MVRASSGFHQRPQRSSNSGTARRDRGHSHGDSCHHGPHPPLPRSPEPIGRPVGPRLTPYRPATSAVVSTGPRPGDHTIRTEPRDRFEPAQRRPGPRPRRHTTCRRLTVISTIYSACVWVWMSSQTRRCPRNLRRITTLSQAALESPGVRRSSVRAPKARRARASQSGQTGSELRKCHS